MHLLALKHEKVVDFYRHKTDQRNLNCEVKQVLRFSRDIEKQSDGKREIEQQKQ